MCCALLPRRYRPRREEEEVESAGGGGQALPQLHLLAQRQPHDQSSSSALTESRQQSDVTGME
jgi:hypothetical protein